MLMPIYKKQLLKLVSITQKNHLTANPEHLEGFGTQPNLMVETYRSRLLSRHSFRNLPSTHIFLYFNKIQRNATIACRRPSVPE